MSKRVVFLCWLVHLIRKWNILVLLNWEKGQLNYERLILFINPIERLYTCTRRVLNKEAKLILIINNFILTPKINYTITKLMSIIIYWLGQQG